ncbi:MAG: hypothetical protein [Microviridae sp. ct0DW36]|nr:MAG: hypothetical protein [Microviridae sp. ct0DW36]
MRPHGLHSRGHGRSNGILVLVTSTRRSAGTTASSGQNRIESGRLEIGNVTLPCSRRHSLLKSHLGISDVRIVLISRLLTEKTSTSRQCRQSKRNPGHKITS